MNDGQPNTITVITTVVVFIIGAILLLVGDKAGDKKKKQMLSIVGTAFIASAGISIFINSAELREILVAFAVVFAAIIAALSIYQSRQIRQDSIERESRDRRERLIDEVAKWLRELEGRALYKPRAIAPGMEDLMRRSSGDPKVPIGTWLKVESVDRTVSEMNALAGGIKEAEYYQKLTLKIDRELSSLIEVIVNNLKQRRQLYSDTGYQPDYGVDAKKAQLLKELYEHDDRPLEGLGLSDQDIILVRFGRNANTIRKSILKAVDRVIELKTSLIQASDFVSPWRL